jgi:hypothetical protein
MMQPTRIRNSHTLDIMQPTNFLFYRVFTKENTTSFLRKISSLFFLQELRPLTPLKATYRFTSLTVIGMKKIMCNTIVDTNPTLARSVWRNSSGCDLYEHFESIQQPFNTHDPPVETGPFGQTMNHPIDQVINPTITSAQVHPNAGHVTSTHSQGTSIPTPIFTKFHSTAPHVPHDLAGTSFHQRMQTLSIQIQSTRGKPPSIKPFKLFIF